MASEAFSLSNYHTQVPNLVTDIVCPLLSGPEATCLLYIVRRTYGFTDGNGGRKARDTISLSQFEDGIVSGNYLLDLGTQLSKNTIRTALKGLEKKDLVEARYSCTNCFWDQEREDGTLKEITGKRPSCPRCRSSLSKSWAVADLTPAKIVKLLNDNDKAKRIWRWDRERRKFAFELPDSPARTTEEDIEEELERLRELVWYPELVEEAIELANKQLKGTVSLKRQVNGFYAPVWKLQERYPSPPLVKYALEQTIKGPALRNENTARWFRYMEAVAKSNAGRFTGKSKGEKTSEDSLREREMKMRDLLRRAAELNGSGKAEQARALLSDILSQTKPLAPLFNGDEDLCECSLREAFKQGRSDFVGIEPNPYGLDLYPEWSWTNKHSEDKS